MAGATMTRVALVLGAASALAAPAQAPAALPERSFAVRCGTLLVGDGTTLLRDCWLVVRDGRIAAVGAQTAPADLPVVDASDRVVMPGIVAVDSDLSAARDDSYSVTPDVLALDGFDFALPQRDALSGGVTTVYLSPGRDRLVSGQGAVVKTAGVDIVARILDENAFLRVNFGDAALRAPRVFEPTVHPTDDDPLLPSRIQTPTARIGLLPELRALFRDAAGQTGLQGKGAPENRYDPAPLQRALGGELPLRCAAPRARDIRAALDLQAELGLRMVLEDPYEIAALAARARQQGVAATFRLPLQPGQPRPGGEDRAQLQQDPPPPLDAAARAALAGIEIGLAPAAGTPLRDYLLAAALAVRHGLSEPAALRAIGLGAARVLGVDARVGSLAIGKDADFVVLSGEPLAIGTMVESTWIDGKVVYRRRTDETLLAIRCGKILDGEGRVHRGGTLLVQGSRIKAIGEDLAIPYGARRIDLPQAVMTPGFIDASSHLGLAGDGTGVPPGQPGQKLEQAIRHDDPMFAPALAAGVTTVLTAGKDGGLLSGRIVAVKTGASDRASMLLAPIAGQRAVFDAIGPDAIKPLRDQLDRARKYADQWAAYDKAYAEWKSGKRPAQAAEPPPAAANPAAAPAEDPVSGTWEATIDIQGRFQLTVLLDLTLEGTKVGGKVRLSFGGRDLPPQDIESGSFENGTLKLTFRGMGGSASLEGKVQADSFTGSIALGPMGDQPLTARRTAKQPGAGPARPIPTSSAPKTDSDEPKRPNVDEGLEPLRAVIEKRAALVVKTSRGRAIAEVVALLEQAQVPYVLDEPEGAIDDAGALGGAKPAVLLGPALVSEQGRDFVNAAAVFADRDLPLLLGSRECAGARDLPLHAAYAVRYGLSPDDALAALTSNVARTFRLDDRVGSLKKGRHADFVVFSGDPFEPTSRILLVGCNGTIVVDNRQERP